MRREVYSKHPSSPLLELGLLISSGIILFFIISAKLSLPEVHRDVITKKCVKVKSSDSKHSCSNLPEIYDLVWTNYGEN